MPNSTAIILRPADAKPIRVLEVDGPSYSRRTHPVQRGEGDYYYLITDNQIPVCDLAFSGTVSDMVRFKDWDEPHWELALKHDGTIEIYACRPSAREICDGELHGRWGSVIKLAAPTRKAVTNGLRIARRLCLCSKRGVVLNRRQLGGISAIYTDIPIRW